jgi:hypothetical protein
MSDPADPLAKLCRTLHAVPLPDEAEDPARQAAIAAAGRAYVEFLEAVGDMALQAGVEGYVMLTVTPAGIRTAAWADGDGNLIPVERLARAVSTMLTALVGPPEEPTVGHA